MFTRNFFLPWQNPKKQMAAFTKISSKKYKKGYIGYFFVFGTSTKLTIVPKGNTFEGFMRLTLQLKP